MPTVKGGKEYSNIVHCRAHIDCSFIARSDGASLRLSVYSSHAGHLVRPIAEINTYGHVLSLDSAIFHQHSDTGAHDVVVLLFVATAEQLSYCWIPIDDASTCTMGGESKDLGSREIKLISLKEANSRHVQVLWVESVRQLLYYNGTDFFCAAPSIVPLAPLRTTFSAVTLTSDMGNPHKLSVLQKSQVIELQEISPLHPHLRMVERSEFHQQHHH